jgi:hypothetical protein
VVRSDNELRIYQNVGPHFNLLPDAESMDYFCLFSNDELLNNIAIEETGTRETKLQKFSKARGQYGIDGLK